MNAAATRGRARDRRYTARLARPPPGLVPEEYVLTNPALNYAAFLLRAVLPTVLHVVIAISAAYAVGSEFRRRSMRAWWQVSGHSIATALVGKLLPYFVVLLAMFALMVGILDVWLGVSFRGDVLLMTVAAMLLIVAYQLIGCLLQLLTRNLALGLSLTGHHRLAGLRLCRRRLSGDRDGLVPARMGRDPAAALVYPDPVRPGLARRAAAPDGRAVRLSSAPSRQSSCCWCGCASARSPARVLHARSTEDGAHRPGFGVAGAFFAEWRRVLARSRRARAVRAGAGALRGVLSAALSRPAGPQHPDRRRRPGQHRRSAAA